MIRKITKDLKSAHRSSISRFFALIKDLFKRMDWPLKFEDKVMKKASKAAKTNAARVRRMLILGIIFYGDKIAQKEFYLRKISTLSLYLFGLLAVLAKLKAEKKEGTYDKEELELLTYFLLEAKRVRMQNTGIFDTKSEKLIGRIMKSLSGTS